ncbi:MAG: hypothetical protein COB85_05050 [Bacteroidetes bacterium]|nr:MAG: hypothetical protein COB85_05050 [Bacteroidota bacterium]
MKKLQLLLEEIAEHSALNNSFYDLWLDRKLSFRELEIFARNYGAWVKAFPDSLAILFTTIEDPIAKIEYVNTLYSEMGYGQPDKVHWKLLDQFWADLANQLGEPERLNRERLEKEVSIIKFTTELIEGERELYGGSREIAVGAQLALEWQAYSMLRKLYEGAQNYKGLWKDPDGFYESCEYFYAHLGAAEKEHKVESLNAVKQYLVSEQSTKEIIDGFNDHLNLIANFWEGIYSTIQKVKSSEDASYVPHV